MSHDAWGGGSDADPKLRLKELGTLKDSDAQNAVPQVPREPYRPKKPAISVLDALMIIVTLTGLVVLLS